MSLPEQVRLQAERANELMAQSTQPPGEPTAPEAAAPAPQVEPPAPAAPAEPTPPAPPAPAPVENWEHKYRTLQGVVAAQKRDYDSRIAALESKIAAPAPAPAPAPALQARVTDQDVETYGTEMLDLIGRKATEIAEQMVSEQMAKLAPQLEQTRAQVDNVTQRVYANAEQEFYGELAKVVTDWEAVNASDKFKAWLAADDPFSGVQRQALLETAASKLDHLRVATFFTAFKAEAGLTAPAPAPVPAPTPSPSPRPVGTATAPAHTEPAVGVSRTQIGAHYRRSATDPTYRASAEAKAFEVRMQQALAANKVTEA